MEIKFTQEYFLKVVPEWYDPEFLSGQGPLEQQICEYEKQRAEKDDRYLMDKKRGNLTAEIVPEKKKTEEACIYCFSKACKGDCPESQIEPVEMTMQERFDEKGVDGYSL